MKAELEITYIFISYLTVTLQRQASAFYKKKFRINSYESKELIDEEIDLTTENFNSFEKIDFQFQLEELVDNFHLLTKIERFILLEKHVKQRSDADIGKALHISGQMVSKKKRKAYAKLRKIFSFQ
ncbi:sigma-70 family RNA polymerase sigma factor [Enterococcus faecalis]|nr:sigma-70 family RNA polymerase sigma factor [Enterococcus faecalis]EJI7179231.1 sigma-70 family RNA polymerase sigma factor [Enterococcus faecalis]